MDPYKLPLEQPLGEFESEYRIDPEIKAKLRTMSSSDESDFAAYNDFLWAEFNREFKGQDGRLNSNYKCFNFEVEKQRIDLHLHNNNAYRIVHITFLLEKIKDHFDWPKCREVKIYYNLSSFDYLYVFPTLFEGWTVEFNKRKWARTELLHYTHVSEIVKFYKYLEVLLTKATQPLANEYHQYSSVNEGDGEGVNVKGIKYLGVRNLKALIEMESGFLSQKLKNDKWNHVVELAAFVAVLDEQNYFLPEVKKTKYQYAHMNAFTLARYGQKTKDALRKRDGKFDLHKLDFLAIVKFAK